MNVDNPVLNTISLCAGVGMLDEGFAAGLRHLGIDCRTVLYAEREAYPCAVLESRMEEGSIHPAPIWCGDFTRLDGRQFRGMVDGIIAGFPCQDLSVAGNRAGLDGARSGLFFSIPDLADDCDAWFMFLENVSGIATATASVVDEAEGELEERAAARVLGELADRGWNAEWITIPASDVGASHGRARWFCFAWRMGDTRLQHVNIQQWKIRAKHSGAGGELVNAEHTGLSATEIGKSPQQGNVRCLSGQIDACESSGSGVAIGEVEHAESVISRELSSRNEPGNTGLEGACCELGKSKRTRWPTARSGHSIDARGKSEPGCSYMADAISVKKHQEQQRPEANERKRGSNSTGGCCSFGCEALADASQPGLQGGELGRACPCDGGGVHCRTDFVSSPNSSPRTASA